MFWVLLHLSLQQLQNCNLILITVEMDLPVCPWVKKEFVKPLCSTINSMVCVPHVFLGTDFQLTDIDFQLSYFD